MSDFDLRAAQAAAGLKQQLRLEGMPRVLVQVGHSFPHEAMPVEASLPLATLDGIPDSPGLGPPPDLGLVGDSRGEVLLGRGHRYLFEGRGLDPVQLPIAAAIRCGVRDVILVETCLSLRDDLRIGTWVAVTDCVNNLGFSPLAARLTTLDCPFQDISDAFSQELNAELINAVADTCICPRLGVYQADIGPHYASPAEAAIARRNGADVLGNGIIPEAVLAAGLGCRVSALLLVVGQAATYRGKRHRHPDTLDAAEFCGPPMLRSLFAALRETT
jgi:purine-nucleoside phosphorylase